MSARDGKEPYVAAWGTRTTDPQLTFRRTLTRRARSRHDPGEDSFEHDFATASDSGFGRSDGPNGRNAQGGTMTRLLAGLVHAIALLVACAPLLSVVHAASAALILYSDIGPGNSCPCCLAWPIGVPNAVTQGEQFTPLQSG